MATTDSKFMGWYLSSEIWTTMACSGANEVYGYSESGSYFGCATIYTACTNSLCASGSSCITQTMHSTFPPPAPDPSQKSKLFCGANWRNYELYRERPTSHVSGSLAVPSTTSPSPGASISGSSAAPTTSATSSSQTSTSASSPSTSPGVIAGASIAGLALLLLIGFLIWFFGFHRPKARALQTYQPGLEQQQASEVEAKRFAPTQYAHQYSPAVQDASGAWAHSDVRHLSELSDEHYDRRH